jgi:hypothetical protein
LTAFTAATTCTFKGLSPPIASTAIAMCFSGMLLMSERAEQTAQDAFTSITSTPL